MYTGSSCVIVRFRKVSQFGLSRSHCMFFVWTDVYMHVIVMMNINLSQTNN